MIQVRISAVADATWNGANVVPINQSECPVFRHKDVLAVEIGMCNCGTATVHDQSGRAARF